MDICPLFYVSLFSCDNFYLYLFCFFFQLICLLSQDFVFSFMPYTHFLKLFPICLGWRGGLSIIFRISGQGEVCARVSDAFCQRTWNSDAVLFTFIVYDIFKIRYDPFIWPVIFSFFLNLTCLLLLFPLINDIGNGIYYLFADDTSLIWS